MVLDTQKKDGDGGKGNSTCVVWERHKTVVIVVAPLVIVVGWFCSMDVKWQYRGGDFGDDSASDNLVMVLVVWSLWQQQL